MIAMSEIAGRPTRVGVRRGATIPHGRFESQRIEAWADTDLPPGLTVAEALSDLSGTLETFVMSRKSAILASKPAAPDIPQVQLDPAQLDGLEWHEYRAGSRAAWTFADRAPPSLVKALEEKPLTVGEFRYRLSGPAENPRMFVSRSPLQEKM